MRKMKKIGICMAAAAGAAGVVGVSAKAVERVRKKWFLRGFEAGQLMGSLTAAESVHEKNMVQKKYDDLCDEYDELSKNYNEMLDYYGGDDN